jgi:CRISPR-associated protein Cas2
VTSPSSSDALRYVVCYDVPVNSRRTRIAKCLDDYGGRVQYSVFEMVLDRRLFDNLVAELTKLIDPRTDRVIVFPVCAACCRKAVYLGLSATDTRPGEEIVFIV